MYSPYQAPATPLYDAPAPPPAPWARWVVLAVAVSAALAMTAGIALMIVASVADSRGDRSSDALAGVGALLLFSSCMLYFVKFVARLMWLYAAWSWIPEPQRYSSAGRRFTPGTAVAFLFIPYFNLYWLFVTHMGLCDAVDRYAAFHGIPARTPRGLMIGACVSELLPIANLFAAPFLWFFALNRFTNVAQETAVAASRARGPQGFA
jgi:hypothetical protein